MSDTENAEDLTLILQTGAPCVVLFDGQFANTYQDGWHAATGDVVRSPIEKAVVVARLRALADELEKVEPYLL